MDAPRRTSQGFLAAPASLTRAGVLVYSNADGSERHEYRPSAEVFNADSLASLVSAPVTDLHPPVMVNAANRGDFDKGNVGDNVIRDGQRVAATIYVKDGRLISSIERGDGSEVSCGYSCDLEMVAGVVPAGEPDAGKKYDAIQRSISYNHVAIVPKGRAGADVRLHLDADGHAVAPSQSSPEIPMHKERIDGVDYDVGTPAHVAAVARRADADKARTDAATALKADRDALEVRAIAAEEKAKKLDAATTPERLDALVAERHAQLEEASAIMGERFDGKAMDAKAIRAACVAHAFPDVKLDGLGDGVIDGLYIAAKKHATDAGADLASLRTDAEPATKKRAPVLGFEERVRLDAEERQRNMWRADGAELSKDKE